MASGRTHSSGTTATSWQILLVTARRSSDAQAGRTSHSTAACGFAVSAAPFAKPQAAALARVMLMAQYAQTVAKTASEIDHTTACDRRLIAGSTSVGYVSSARKDAMFDS